MTELKLIVFDFDGVFTNGNYKHRDVHCRDLFGLTLLINYQVAICTRSKGEQIPEIVTSRINFVIKKCTNKYKKIKELGYQDNEIAYMGDDTHDLECITKFKYSACPNDAHPQVLEEAKFISKFNGGNGAVREFIDYLISHQGKITAIIPVRSGSTRCINKNIRPFGNTNLLRLKIQTLKKVKGLEQIMVSSNDDEMLQIAEEEGAIPVKRDEKYCTSDCSGSDMYCALAEAVPTEMMLYTHCVCPYIKVETYQKIIDTWYNNRDCDSIMTAHELREYLWYNNKPLNYEFDNAPPSQNIRGYYIPTFGCSLVKKDFVLKNRNIIGFKPYFYHVDQLEATDIDTPFEFYTAELLYKNEIKKIENIDNQLSLYNIKLFLDCTIRDGGYLNNWSFTDNEVIDCYKAVTEAGFDYFEIGFRTAKNKLKGKGKWCYSLEKDINRIYRNYQGTKIAVMAKLGTVSINDFVPKEKSHIDLVRVLVPHNNKDRISVIEESLANECYILCDGLIKLGYEVCINFACFDQVLDTELNLVINKIKELPIKVIYIADTYGSLNQETILKEIRRIERLGFKVGIHCHNNKGNALSKSLIAYHQPNVLMIDSCIGGKGRGAGNLWSELFFMEIEKNYIPLLEYSDKYFGNRERLLYALTSHLNIHPDFVKDILKLDLSMKYVIKLLDNIKIECNDINQRNYIKGLVNKFTS